MMLNLKALNVGFRMGGKSSSTGKWVWLAALGVLSPGLAMGCACGCGVFEVGTSAMFPEGTGGMVFNTFAYQNQDQNWGGNSQRPSIYNPDKNIATAFQSVGLQYMFNRSWGVEAELPWAYRSFSTISSLTGRQVNMKWWSLGDIRLHGLYTGFSEDLSSGIDFGLKLPTGNFNQEDPGNNIDRDTQIGTGSTDILLGGFHRGNLSDHFRLDWFFQEESDLPVMTQGNYRPGFEWDGALGMNYRGFRIGSANVAPIAQLLFSERTRDFGSDANSPNSGFTRLLVSPGLEIHMHPFDLYADLEVPVVQHFNGYQLAAPVAFKVNLSYMF